MDLSSVSFPLRAESGAYLGMTTPDEQAWLREFTAQHYSGEWAFVELGCFFGSLTLTIAEGMKKAQEAGKLIKPVVDSYDLFYFHESMLHTIEGTGLEGILKEKGWFFEVFKANTASFAEFIRPHWKDLAKAEWNGGPIEVLLLDCLKYDNITNNVFSTFFPHLIPGKSRILHQDYFHFYEWWTHLLTFEQRELLKPETEVPNSGMFAFQVIGDFNAYCENEYDQNRVFAKTSPEQLEEAYAWNFQIVSEKNHPNIHAAKVWAYVCIGEVEQANRLYRDGLKQFGTHFQFTWLAEYCLKYGKPLSD